MGATGESDAGDDGIDTFLADLARWAGDTRVTEAAGGRARERWLRHQAAEEARFSVVLVDLAERGAGVSVRTSAGRTIQGRIAAVGRDFCVLRHDPGPVTLLAFAAITAVRAEPGFRSDDAGSMRPPAPALALIQVLARLAPERPRVRVTMEGGGEALAGELRSVGADVATLRLEGDPPATVYLQLSTVREVTLPT